MNTIDSIRLGALVALSMGIGCSNPHGGPTCDPSVPNTICTIVGTGLAGGGGDNGPATEASIYTPQDTAVAPDGALWLLDFNNYTIRRVDDKGTITTVVGTGILGDSPDPGMPTCPATDAVFNHTPNMLFHDGYLYMAAWHNSRVKRVKLADMMLENFAGTGKRALYNGDDGPALQAAVDLPSSIAIAPNGDVIIMDQANQVLRNVDAAGNIHHLAGTCLVEWDSATYEPCAKDPDLHACPGSNKATYCTNTKDACTLPCSPGYSGDGGPALSMRMGQPFGQAADPAGRITYNKAGELIFADTINNRIRKIDTAGIVTTIVGDGTEGHGGDGGPATLAQLNHPIDVALGDDETLYFTDTENNCIRKVDPSGIISTVVGQCDTAGTCGGGSSTGGCFADTGGDCSNTGGGICFSGDGGLPTAAKLNRPYGVEVAGKKLYVADSYNNRIRVVNLP